MASLPRTTYRIIRHLCPSLTAYSGVRSCTPTRMRTSHQGSTRWRGQAAPSASSTPTTAPSGERSDPLCSAVQGLEGGEACWRKFCTVVLCAEFPLVLKDWSCQPCPFGHSGALRGAPGCSGGTRGCLEDTQALRLNGVFITYVAVLGFRI